MLLSCLANCGHYSFKSHVTPLAEEGDVRMWGGIGYQFDSGEDSYMPNFQLVGGIGNSPSFGSGEILYAPSFGANVNWDFYSDYNVSLGFKTESLLFPYAFANASYALSDNHHVGLELQLAGLTLNYEYAFAES